MTSSSDDELKVTVIWSCSSWWLLGLAPHVLLVSTEAHPGETPGLKHSPAPFPGRELSRAVQGFPVLLLELFLCPEHGQEPGKGVMLRSGDSASSAGDTGPCFSWPPFVSPVHFSRGWRGGNAISLLSVSVCRAR